MSFPAMRWLAPVSCLALLLAAGTASAQLPARTDPTVKGFQLYRAQMAYQRFASTPFASTYGYYPRATRVYVPVYVPVPVPPGGAGDGECARCTRGPQHSGHGAGDDRGPRAGW